MPRKSKLRQQYMKQRKRVQNLIYNLRKRGYSIDTRDVLGDIPQRNYSKYIRRLEKLRTGLEIAKQFGAQKTIEAPQAITNPNDLPQWYDKEYVNTLNTIRDQLNPEPASFLENIMRKAEQIGGRRQLMENLRYLEEEEGITISYKMNYNPALTQRYAWELTRIMEAELTEEQAQEIWDTFEQLLGEYQDEMGTYDPDDY